MEYKSPLDHLNIDTFYKAGAYASLYKAYGKYVDERKADDITVSVIRENKPVGLFEYFKEHQIKFTNPYKGIYYIMGAVLFPTQIIVTKELNLEEHIWLKALSCGMQKQQMRNLFETIEKMDLGFDRELADSVLQVSVKANKQVVEDLRGDKNMCQALLEIMEPEINKIKEMVKEETVREERQKGIKSMVTALRDCNQEDAEIVKAIVKIYGVSETEAEHYL